MTIESAHTLFGAEAVRKALDEPNPAALTDADLKRIREVANEHGPGGLRSWALAQPWPTFCAIVRVITGDAALDKLEGLD